MMGVAGIVRVPIPAVVTIVNKATKLRDSVRDNKLKVQYGVRKRLIYNRVEGVGDEPRTKN